MKVMNAVAETPAGKHPAGVFYLLRGCGELWYRTRTSHKNEVRSIGTNAAHKRGKTNEDIKEKARNDGREMD